ncbi:MAG: hypothetical protein SP1CHLAM54_14330 [Chlamydiia bacterium]|nr:hypothetical protein [Chlamydiia bacterium]MCH9616325.1 hypothetical protein [Chlamydiia bacterium]MCH9629689.1 hypothetical protein [Chlamydiia bacterium]
MDDYKKYLSRALPIVLLAAAMIFHFTSKKQRSGSDYLAAKVAFSQGKDMSKLLKSHPELKGRYGAVLDQRKIAQGEKVHVNLDDGSPYAAFAKTTETIVDGRIEEALKEALDLKANLDIREEYGKVLAAYNLMRIASLYQELGEFANEKKTLKELKDADLAPLLSHIRDQEISLLDYINERLAS